MPSAQSVRGQSDYWDIARVWITKECCCAARKTFTNSFTPHAVIPLTMCMRESARLPRF